MYKARLSPRFLWIALSVLSLILLSQYFSTEYIDNLSRKAAQAIEETETLSVFIDATGEEGK